MRKLTPLLILFVIISCAPKDLPPESVPSFRKNEVLIRVGELQKTVIALYDQKGITKERADIVVGFTVTTAEAIRNGLAGWEQTTKSAWAQLNMKLKVPEGPLQTIWSILNGLIGGL